MLLKHERAVSGIVVEFMTACCDVEFVLGLKQRCRRVNGFSGVETERENNNNATK